MIETYWIDLDRDLAIVLDGCPVVIRRPGGTLVEIDRIATPLQKARMLEAHVGAILLTPKEKEQE